MCRIWLDISKIIDVFHLKNHKRNECHTIYNPETMKSEHPHFNIQACEQTFSWLSRYHRILSSVPKDHNHFFLHRLVKRRNMYNSLCYSKGKNKKSPYYLMSNIINTRMCDFVKYPAICDLTSLTTSTIILFNFNVNIINTTISMISLNVTIINTTI